MQGRVYTLGIELAFASDVRLCADDATFAQLEIARGHLPLRGRDVPRARAARLGQRHAVPADRRALRGPEALRIGLVQEVTKADVLLDRAIAIADHIAAQAPLGVRATIASARLAQREGEEAAAAALRSEIVALMASDDAREGLQSFVERRAGRFTGR